MDRRIKELDTKIAETEHQLAQLRERRAYLLHTAGIHQLTKFKGNEISSRTFYALARANIHNTRDLMDYVKHHPIQALLSVRGFGQVAMDETQRLIEQMLSLNR